MSVVETIRCMGYEIRVKDNGNLCVSPWSTCTDKHKKFIRSNKEAIKRELQNEENKIVSGPSVFPYEFFTKGRPERFDMPDNCAVITATDENFFNGVYLLAWTVLNKNNTRFVCYDLGIKNKRLKTQMQKWGVEFKSVDLEISKDYDGWQTLNKPWYIDDAMTYSDCVIWLDADTWYYKNLNTMLQISKEGFFIPDHGRHCPQFNANNEKIYEVVSRPKISWGEKAANYWPCAGVIGCSQKDLSIITQWKDRLKLLQNEGLIEYLSYYDQGALQDVIDCDLQNGFVWNNLNALRTGSPYGVFRQSFYGFSNIYHAGGERKPWFNWNNLSWPHPTEVYWNNDNIKK